MATLWLVLAAHAVVALREHADTESGNSGTGSQWRRALAVFVLDEAVIGTFFFSGGSSLVVALACAGGHMAWGWLARHVGVRADRRPVLAFLVEEIGPFLVPTLAVLGWVRANGPPARGPVPVPLDVLTSTGAALAVFLFSCAGGDGLVTRILSSLPDPSRGAGPAPGLTRAGRWIGVLERLLLIALVWQRAWEAVGLVLATKSIARFRDLEERSFAESYLVGTLASLLVAVVLGTILGGVVGTQ